MKLVTYDAIMGENPCYDPIEIGMPKDYSDTLVNFVKEYRPKVKKLQDINWIACRFLDKKTRDYYAWWCVNEIKHLMEDERSLKAIDTLKLYIDGIATFEELNNAAAVAAAYNDAADFAAAYDAYDADAYNAAYAAYAAAFSCTAADAYNAAYAAYAAAADAEEMQTNLQLDKLVEILENK